MLKLKEIKKEAPIRGLEGDKIVRIVSCEPVGRDAVNVFEEEFQLFMSLLDGDRFYGKFREGVHKVDITDMMRRMVKEALLKFDGTPLFPERRAYTANYELSDQEADLYANVTDYVRNEMNRADKLDGKKKNTVGFALTQLQRRLASSPEAIYQSLKRRRKKLEDKLKEMKRVARGQFVNENASGNLVAETLGEYVVRKQIDIPDNLDEADDELTGEEYEAWAEEVVDQYLDLQPIDDDDHSLVKDVLDAPWITNNLEALALHHASTHLAPDHYQEVKARREKQIDKIHAAVRERLVKEINYQSAQYIKLSEDVAAGRQPRVQPEMAKRRYENLTARLEQREKELTAMRSVVSSSPVVIGGSLIIPQGMLAQRKGEPNFTADAAARSRIEQVAMNAVIKTEKAFGHEVKDVAAEKCGWDVTARPPAIDGKLLEDRHIEVKGKAKGQSTITVSRNEIIYGLNQEDKFILAIVIVDGDKHEGPYYIKNPFSQEPDFGVASINYELKDLMSMAVAPEQTLQVAE